MKDTVNRYCQKNNFESEQPRLDRKRNVQIRTYAFTTGFRANKHKRTNLLPWTWMALFKMNLNWQRQMVTNIYGRS